MKLLPLILTCLVCSSVHAADVLNEELDQKLRDTALKNKPAVLHLPVGWQEIRGLPGHSAWHILGTMWRVRLHPDSDQYRNLDKTKAYTVHGVVLDQNYGVIDVWVYDLKKN